MLTVFNEFDTTDDGEIDLQEFKGALEVLGINLAPNKVRMLFAAFDKDHNNTVDFVECGHAPSAATPPPRPLPLHGCLPAPHTSSPCTVRLYRFCHVIFPDLDEEKLLEEYAARVKDTPRTRAKHAHVMSQLLAEEGSLLPQKPRLGRMHTTSWGGARGGESAS